MPIRRVEPVDTQKYLPDGGSFIKDVPFVPIYQDEKFILKHCRKAWDQPSGYRPDLYEKWTSGRAAELERYRKKFNFLKRMEEVDSNCLKLLEFFEIVEDSHRLQMNR